MNIFDYGTYFVATFIVSTVFALGGVGSAVALVPVFLMMGLPLNPAKAVGLFVNSASTITASTINVRKRLVDFRFALPLVVSVLVATPIGAWLSRHVSEELVQWVLTAFLITSSGLLIFSRREAKAAYARAWIMLILGGVVGLVSGLVGVGGGTPILAVLLLLGFDTKKAAYAVSFVIPFSTIGGFFTYLSFVEMNWTLLATVAAASILGGFLGQRIMHLHMNAIQVKKLIAIILLILSGRMLWTLL